MFTENTIAAAASPCRGCPWLVENHGKRHADGWYTKANLRRLWVGIRRGEQMTCHATDATNPVSERAQAQGQKVIPEHAAVRECTGALIMGQREADVFNRVIAAGGNFSAYRKLRGARAMTMTGLRRLVERAIFTTGYVTPNLNQPVALPDSELPWPADVTDKKDD